jgi:hypothetical protein
MRRQMIQIIRNQPALWIGGLFLLLYLPFIGQVHLFDWDEINFAESAREMLVLSDWSTVRVNYEPFWEKPPLFFWFQAACMKTFGVNEFSARLPNVLVGFVSMLFIFHMGKKLFSEQMAVWWVLFYMGSITPSFYFRTGIIDPMFNLFIFLSWYALLKALKSRNIRQWALSGLMLGLAVLTKGPVAILIVLLGFLLLVALRRKEMKWLWKGFFMGIITSVAVSSLWFVPEILKNGTGFIVQFIEYQLDLLKNPVASHGQPWFYHPVVLLLGCFPASILALNLLFQWKTVFKNKWPLEIYSFWVLFWVVLVLFSLVETKIVHYSSMCYLPLTGLVAYRMGSSPLVKRWERGILGSIGSIYWLMVLLVAIVLYRTDWFWENYREHLPEDVGVILLSGEQMSAWSFGFMITFLLFVGIYAVRSWLKGEVWRKRNLFIWIIGLSIVPILVVPVLETKIQGDLISFYKGIKDEDAYIAIKEYKSYAHWFYAEAKPLEDDDKLQEIRNGFLKSRDVKSRLGLTVDERKAYEQEQMEFFLTSDELDKPVYLITPARKAHLMLKHRTFRSIYHGNGFVVFKRLATP